MWIFLLPTLNYKESQSSHGESLNFSKSAKEGVTVASPVSGTQDEALFPTAKDRHHRSRDPLAVDLWRPPAATLKPVAVAFITHFFLSVFFHLALLVCVCTGKKGELHLLPNSSSVNWLIMEWFRNWCRYNSLSKSHFRKKIHLLEPRFSKAPILRQNEI